MMANVTMDTTAGAEIGGGRAIRRWRNVDNARSRRCDRIARREHRGHQRGCAAQAGP
jgi:hypothetical protein